jgi:histidyl-tRNA synthetase
LRVLDCKSVHCKEVLKEAPVIRDYLCPDCAAHYSRVLELLRGFGVAYEEQPRLVRGLDYYTRTAFEVVAPGLGAQDAVAGGGRYNGLSQELGGPALPAVGFAIGQDRLLEVLPKDLGQEDRRLVFLAALGEEARNLAFKLMQELRKVGIPAEMDFAGRSLKAQMSLADRLGAVYAVILGERELAQGEAIVRPMVGSGYRSGDMQVQITRQQESVRFENLVSLLVDRVLKKAGSHIVRHS